MGSQTARRSAPSLLTAMCFCLSAGLAIAGHAAAARHDHTAPTPSFVPDLDTEIDANQMSMSVTNQGSWAFDQLIGDAGLEWPIGTGKHVVFAAGLWLGARVNGEVQVTVGEFSQEYAAGPLGANGLPIDPTEIDPIHRVYKLNAGDGPGTPDWDNWPIQFGAPTDTEGNPLILGEQTLWCVYNDAVAFKHTNDAGSSEPLGVEVRQTVYAFDQLGALANTAILDFEVVNKGVNTLEDMYISFWLDPDLGGFADDLAGCDTTLALGYCYNATNDDSQYGANPPALGCAILQGPIVNDDTLEMTSFNVYRNGTDPSSPFESYNYMQGLSADGSPQTCQSEPTQFVFSGDPVAGTGCLDTDAADKRMMLNSGPITMNPGDQQHVVVAAVVGGVPGQGDRLTNVTLLKSYTSTVQELLGSGGTTPVELAHVEALSAEGHIILKWRTSFETGHLGFNVLRSERGSDRFARVNDDLIRAAGGDDRGGRYEFVDHAVSAGETYIYRLEAIDILGGTQVFDLGIVTVRVSAPTQVVLHQNRPNPFNPTTAITFELPIASHVTLRIYDTVGRPVRTLVNDTLVRASHTVDWNGLDDLGRPLGSGVYFYWLTTGDRTLKKKLTLLR